MISRSRYHQRGFTLMELLAVLSLVGFMVGIAVVPAYQKWLSEVRLETKARQLFNDLQWARNMALRLHQPVMVCKSSDKIHCGGAWEDGWLVMKPRASSASKRLRYNSGVGIPYTIAWRGARNVEGVRFNANGRSAGYNGRFVLCHRALNRRSIAWMIYISQTGRIRLESSRDLTQCNTKAV